MSSGAANRRLPEPVMQLGHIVNAVEGDRTVKDFGSCIFSFSIDTGLNHDRC